jgi:hypothetical protein
MMRTAIAVALASLALVGCERTTKTTKTPLGETKTTTTKTPGSETTTTTTTTRPNKDDHNADGGVKVRVNPHEGVKVDVEKKRN